MGMKAGRPSHIVIVTWLISAFCAVFSPATQASPRLTVGDTSFDFGTIGQGQPVTAEFVINNRGDEPLLVERMEFSMPGMDARVTQRLEAGEQTTVQVTWNTDRLRRAVEGHVTLYLNDPVTPRLVLSLSGDVIPAIEFSPKPAFYFSQFGGESQTQSITLRNNGDTPLTIEGLYPSSDIFKAEFKEVEVGMVFELTVSTGPDTKPGRFREALAIRTSDARYAELRVEVNILVKPDVFVSIAVVDFGRLSLSKLSANKSAIDFIQQTVVISRRSDVMRLTSITTDVAFLKLNFNADEPSNAFMLEVGVDPEKLEAGPIEGTIRLTTDDPEYPEIVIPVAGTISN